MLILFWASVVVLCWVTIGYPAFAFARGWVLARSYKTDAATPSASVIVAAYNEADAIGERIENLLSLDYPQDCLQIVVASDGSTDGTVEIAKTFEDRGVLVLNLPRQGKIPAVNTAMQHVTGDIVVMTDANSHFPAGTVQALIRPFADETVGGVAGNQVYSNDKHLVSGDGEQIYWNLDRRLKQALSRFMERRVGHGGRIRDTTFFGSGDSASRNGRLLYFDGCDRSWQAVGVRTRRDRHRTRRRKVNGRVRSKSPRDDSRLPRVVGTASVVQSVSNRTVCRRFVNLQTVETTDRCSSADVVR